MRALALAASASGMLPSRTYIWESAVQARRSLGRRVMAWSPQPMASLRVPVFMRAMPRACQPSKKAGSSSTQRR